MCALHYVDVRIACMCVRRVHAHFLCFSSEAPLHCAPPLLTIFLSLSFSIHCLCTLGAHVCVNKLQPIFSKANDGLETAFRLHFVFWNENLKIYFIALNKNNSFTLILISRSRCLNYNDNSILIRKF